MKRNSIVCTVAIALLCLPAMASAMNFAYVDAGKLFNKYSETQKTKTYLESEKGKLQEELDTKKKTVADLDAKYFETAKKLQALRDAKKDGEAAALEATLKSQREALANANADLQKFFEESQKRLYQLEDEKMGTLSKVLDERVDKVIEQIAKSKGFEAVFEKRFCYFGGTDITEDVIAVLNAGAPAPAAPAAGGTGAAKQPAPKKGAGK